jgi:hypothetical protein
MFIPSSLHEIRGVDSWDVCFFVAPFIFEANVISNLSGYVSGIKGRYFGYYKKISIFFKNRKTQKFN